LCSGGPSPPVDLTRYGIEPNPGHECARCGNTVDEAPTSGSVSSDGKFFCCVVCQVRFVVDGAQRKRKAVELSESESPEPSESASMESESQKPAPAPPQPPSRKKARLSSARNKAKRSAKKAKRKAVVPESEPESESPEPKATCSKKPSRSYPLFPTMPPARTADGTWQPSATGDWMEKQLQGHVQKDARVSEVSLVGGTGDKETDLVSDPRCKKYGVGTQALSPSHAIEAVGMAIFKHIVQTLYPHRLTRPADKQASTTDVYYAGQKVQAKAASKLFQGKYKFGLRHGHQGNKRPYATEDNLAFSFVVTTCKTSCYLVPAKFAVEHELVGKTAQTAICLPHPEECPPNDPFYQFIQRLPPSQ